MLTTGVGRATSPGWRTLAGAWGPCVRGLPRPTLAAVAALAAAPVLVVLARGGSSFDGALTTAALVSGAAVAFTVDDPAEETLSAVPTALARRRALRGSAIVLGITGLSLLLVAVALTLGDVGGAALSRRGVELAASAALAAAIAGVAQRRGVPSAAHLGAAGGVLSVLLVTALAQRLLRALPSLVDGPHHSRWWLVAGVATVVTAWTWRDPAR